MPILYPIAPGSCNGITVDGGEVPRTVDGGFDVPEIHVPDVIQVVPGLTDVRPDWLGESAPVVTESAPDVVQVAPVDPPAKKSGR